MKGSALPATADLLANSEFWKEEIFWRFLERCNQITFENPQRGLEEARHAPRLAELCAADSSRPERLLVAAYAVLGSANRSCARYDEAEAAYAEAEAHSADLEPLDLVDLKRRRTILRRDQGDYAGALALVNEAIKIYRLEGDLAEPHFLGKCYLARGTVFLQRAWFSNNADDLHRSMLDHMKALRHLRPDYQPRVYYSVIHNLGVVLLDCYDRDALGQALKELGKAQRSLYYKRNTMAKAKLKWLKGLLCNRFGSTRQGERLLLSAMDSLAELGAAFEVAMIALDLGLLYLEEAQPPDVIMKLAAQAHDIFGKLSSDQHALAALELWKDAEEQVLTADFLRSVRDTIAEATKPAM